MRAASIIVDATSQHDLSGKLEAALRTTDISADVVFAFYGQNQDGDRISLLVTDRFPDATLIGGSSSHGVMDQYGLHQPDSIGLLMIEDPDGDYGSASRPLGDDPAGAAEEALRAALEDADCAGELPDLVWTYQAPGHEEQVMAGLKHLVGDRCPVIGGSSADDDATGVWTQISRQGATRDAVVVCVLFPSRPLGHGFQGGYEPNGHTGKITRIDGGRVTKVEGPRHSRIILEIDGRPAAAVYNGWIGGELDGKLATGGTILAETTLAPLSVFAGVEDGIDQFLLVHPEAVRSDGALTTFADVEEGSEIYCMRGDADHLIRRAGRVSRHAIKQIEDAEPAAALIIFCGGCRMAVRDQIGELCGTLKAELGDTPTIVCFTFGEQGPVLGVNKHGNLMISAVVFGS
ncbi:hypothetical protein C8N35_1011062 [Breoghania corrubedonensis]|uniref:Small ligand-binding sensory domain FIST n=1 Tax=Breoghania corrubedonensis TaxID=665038 RepID=A0A2T5VGY3_9HYPH|nr:FIST N-terminal domain-containing protein [Breoghania corrubedonensis]PTW63013.1 hypothetical protein C8N35_1011062 [Breoghania corrubedonensis]